MVVALLEVQVQHSNLESCFTKMYDMENSSTFHDILDLVKMF